MRGPSGRSASFGFQWHVTDRCGLRCAHCYQDEFTARSERPLADLEAMAERVFSGLRGREVSVNVTGGEPFLMPHLVPLLRMLHHAEALTEIHLITNGAVLDEPALCALRSLERVRLLKISVESADASVNDAIRGPGSLARVLHNLPVLRDRSGKDVVLMATLGRRNAGAVPGLVRLAREVGAKGVIFERFVPLGRGRALAGEVLRAEDWRAAVAEVLAAAGSDLDPEDVAPYTAFWIETDPEGETGLRGSLCNLGGESMALMPNGDVTPCRRMATRIGNVLEDPFDVLLARLSEWKPLEGGPDACLGCRAMARALLG